MLNWNKNTGRLHPKHWLLAFCLLAVAGGASAQTCSYTTDSIAQTLTSPITSLAITANRDLPVGSVLSDQRWDRFANVGVRCTSNTIPEYTTMESIGLPLSAWQPSGAGAGKMYQTNLPGVGVTFKRGAIQGSTPNNGDGYIPEAAPISMTYPSSDLAGGGMSFVQALFVKVGDITPGTVNTAGFPRITFRLGTNKLLAWTLNFAGGSIEFVSQTCTTPDQLVPLGDRPQTDFTGIGTGSPFRDFVIELKNCPAFFGSRRDALRLYSYTRGTPTTTLAGMNYGAPSSNAIRFQLTPPAANVQSEGILKLSPPIGGGRNATGVGIEIRRRGASVPIAFNRWLDGLSLVDVAANSTQTIPLSARLVQTAAQVTPGQANGSVEFVLNYN